MWRRWGVVLVLLMVIGVAMQEGKGEAMETDYTELYRPQFHFSTPEGRLADPNGLLFYEGEYHLFHQKMGTWAHAVSRDLIHWEHLPVALEHDGQGQALSGTAVVDWKDTSGLFDGGSGMVAIYTSTAGGESQSIAYSRDNGRTWERYTGNPVLPNPGIKDFRDPKVFWHEESAAWVMAVSTDKSVTFYRSPNLIDWTRTSSFGRDENGVEQGSHVAVWETPDLFALPIDRDPARKKWVLMVSIGDNDVTDGSTNQYFIGEFDGYRFHNDNDPAVVLTTDFGQDFYAAQSFNEMPDGDGRRVWLGWMANWRYPYQSPTYPWMGAMSIPRELTLRTNADGDVRLAQLPVKETETLRTKTTSVPAFTLQDEKKIAAFNGTTYEFELTLSWEELEEAGIRFRQGDGQYTSAGVNVLRNEYFSDRTESGLDKLIDRNNVPFTFGKRFTAPGNGEKRVKIRGLVDESSVELFFNDGETTFTNLIYTKPTNSAVELYTIGGEARVESLTFHHYDSIWRERSAKKKADRLVVSEESVVVKTAGEVTVKAELKPDDLPLNGAIHATARDGSVAKVKRKGKNTFIIYGLKEGTTTVTLTDAAKRVSTEIRVRVADDPDSPYRDGWGPSPLNGWMSGRWDVRDAAAVTGEPSFSQSWSRLFYREAYSGDVRITSTVRWLSQGREGFPKYGFVLMDEQGREVAGFLNRDAHKLETMVENSENAGWQAVDLPSSLDLTVPVELTLERTGDTVTFFVEGEPLLSRTVPLSGQTAIGLMTENTGVSYEMITIE